MRRPGSVALLVGASAAWGASTVTSKYALGGLTALDLLTVEVATATAVLWAALLSGGTRRVTAHWRGFALLGCLEPALSFGLFNAGLARTGATDAALLIPSESLFVVLLAAPILRERLSARAHLALLIGLGGSILVAAEGTGGTSSLLGDVLVLGGAVTAAGYSVAARGVASRAPALSLTAYQFLGATALVAPLAIIEVLGGHSRLASADAAQLVAAVATGLLGSVIAFLLYNHAIARTPASRAAIILNLIPVFGTLAAVVLLAERPGPLQLAGGAIIILSLLVLGEDRAAAPRAEALSLTSPPCTL